MSTTSRTPPVPLSPLSQGAPIWVCHPNLLHCQHRHVRKHHREGGHYDQRRIDGHLFAKCDTCESCYLGVFYSARGGSGAIVHCYAISEAQWRWWNGPDGINVELDEHQPTQHLLALLGYNPMFSPTNPLTGRPQPR